MRYFLNKKLILIFILFINLNIFADLYIVDYRFNFYFYFLKLDNFYKLVYQMQLSEIYLGKKYSYYPKENLDIRIANSAGELGDMLKLPSWIDSYYSDYKIYFQPPASLISQQLLQKAVFTEYASYFIDSYTFNRCPKWFNRVMAIYLYSEYSNRYSNFIFNEMKLSKFEDFSNFEKNYQNYELANEFSDLSELFIIFLNSEYGKSFTDDLLKSLHNNGNFNEIILSKTGMKIEEVYEIEFIKKSGLSK
jgi:hypothetical protein